MVVVAISSTPLNSHNTAITKKTIQCGKRKKDLQHRQPRQFRPQKPSLPYPKSRPTPIILTPKPRPETKLEALDAVVSDLESSLDKGVDLESDVLASLLETCYKLGSLHHGVRIHHLIPTAVLRRNVALSSKLIRLYASRGLVQIAHQVFDRMPQRTRFAFAWNSLISGYAEQGQHEEALALYFQMEEEGIEPDEFTFPRVLKACGGIGSVGIGEAVHRSIVRLGFWDDPFVLNALVDMYAKCGDIVKAKKIFDKIGNRDLVSWNSILTGYVRHGLLTEALETFRLMIREGFEPDSVTVSTIISKITALKFGLEIHGWSIRRGTQWSLSIANSLIVFYSNNGKLKLARHVFDRMPERDIVSWNSIISAHSKSPEALVYFNLMEGVAPDKITFVSLLSTCAHLGMVEEGKRLFHLMRKKYKIRPIMEHYGCMVNLFGRVGMIGEAYRVVTKAIDFVEVGPTLWGALLYSCCLHGNIEIGEVAAERLFDLEPDNEHNFELLMKIYGDANMSEGVERVRKMMVERGLI